MKKILAIFLLGCCAAGAGAEVYEYKPGPFDRLSVRGDMDIVYRNVPDSAGYIRYESNRDFSDKLDVSCNKGKLSIVEKRTDIDFGTLPTLYLYSDYLTSAENEGTGTMDMELTMATPSFSAKLVGNGKIICTGVRATDFSANLVTGNGTIVATGACKNAKLTLTGTGVIQADQLIADDVRCTVVGTGSIGCHASENLDVKGMGTTKIYYYGNPAVKKMGGAKLEHMTDDSVSPDYTAVDSEDYNDSNLEDAD